MSCLFCPPKDPIVAENSDAVAIRDAHPVAPGHSLVIPRRHVEDVMALSSGELAACFELVRDVVERLRQAYSPDGFNVGVNIGKAAGQTVGHAHIHVIPRSVGDVPDPRGGVRGVIPGKRRYQS